MKIYFLSFLFLIIGYVQASSQPCLKSVSSMSDTLFDAHIKIAKYQAKSRKDCASLEAISSKEDIQNQKIAFFIDVLKLTPDEAELFWPIYNQYCEKKSQLALEKKRFISQCKEENIAKLGDAEADALLAKLLELQNRKVAIEKNYYKKMGGVVSSKKLLLLNKAEADFTRLLLHEIKEGKRAN